MKKDNSVLTLMKKCFKIGLLLFVLTSLLLVVFLSNTRAAKLNNNPTSAEATAVSTGTALLNILNASTSENIELTQDITIDVGSTSQYGKNNVYNGTFDGQGYTITITGYRKHDCTDAANVYAGLFSGKLTGTFKNVVINYDANLHFALTNNIETGYSRKEVVDENSYFISAGIITGLLDTNGKIENVQLNISNNAAFSALGIDDGLGNKNKLGGSGGIAGGFAGTMQGTGTVRNSTLNNNGLIFARAENQNAGDTIDWGNNSQIASAIEITAINNPCRSISGGVVGELMTTSPSLVNLVIKGNGVVASNLKPSNNNALTTAYAGNVFGSNRASNFTIDGLLYKSANKSATSPIGTVNNNAGTWAGRAGMNLVISNVFRIKADGDISNTRGKLTIHHLYDFTGNSPITKTSIGENNKEETGKDGGVFKLGWGTGSHTSESNINELDPETATRYKDLWGITYGNVDYTGMTLLGEVTLVANAAQSSAYYISAASYDDRYNQKQYNTVYDDYSLSELGSVTFNFPKTSKNHMVYFFTINSSPMETSFNVESGKKTYDRAGITFTGGPAGSPTLFPGIKWVSEYRDLAGNPNTAYDTVGISGSRTVTTHFRVGTYTVSPYRTTNLNEEVLLQDGEIIAGNSPDNPSEVYVYTAPGSPLTVTIEQKSIEVKTEDAPFPYTKEYDGTSSVTGLRLGEHYLLDGLLPGDASNTYIIFNESESNFVDTSGNPVSNVTTSGYINVELVNCSVNNINYKIDPPIGSETVDIILNNCQITKRTVEMEWLTFDGHTQGLDDEYIFVYQGQRILPNLRVTNPVGDDIVNVSSLTFKNSTSNDPFECIDVGTYHTRVGSLSGEDVANYRLPEDQNIINSYSISFGITPKAIKVLWPSNKIFTFDKNPHAFQCSIENAQSEIYARDTVSITAEYKNANNVIVSELRNAGTYSATAIKTETEGRNNYYIYNTSQITITGIIINPWNVDVFFTTGTNSSVQPLTYNGGNYIGSADGLKVNVSTLNTELTSEYLGLSYKDKNNTPITEVRTVGKYDATAFIKNGTEGNYRYLTTNYTINTNTNSQEIEVIPKEVSLTYGTLSFIYDSYSKKDSVIVNVTTSEIVSGDTVNVTKNWGDSAVINVGSYTLICGVSNPSYKVKTTFEQRTVSITARSINGEQHLTIDAIPDQEYSFSAKEPLPSIRYRGVLLIKDRDYSLTYSNNINAGNAAASVQIVGKGNFKDNITTTFTITKKLLNVNISIPQTLIYNAQSKKTDISATLSGVISGDQSPTIYYDFYDTTTSSLCLDPKAAGNYKVIIKFTEENYRMPIEANRTRTFNILKRELGILFSSYSNLTFINEPLSIGVQFDTNKPLAEPDSGLVSLKQDHLYGPPTNRIPTGQIFNAGTYQTTVTLTGNSGSESFTNYLITSSNLPNTTAQNCNILNYIVKPKDLIISFSQDNTRIYNKSAQHIQYSAKPGYGPLGTDTIENITRLQYTSTTGINTTSVSQAGVYTVTAHSNNNNYKILSTEPNIVRFEITPKPLKLYLTYNELPLENNKEFTYGGANQNIADAIRYSYRPGFSYITGDEPRVDKQVYNGLQKVDTAYTVSDNYRITINLANTEKNYVLITEVENPEFDSVLERHFKIKPRPVQITFNLSENIQYTGASSSEIPVALTGGDGYVSELSSEPSGIIEGETINLLAHVESYLDKSISLDNTEVTYYTPGSQTSYKNCGQYKVKATISNNSNYYIYTSENVLDTKIFNVTPYYITLVPINITKTYGELDEVSDLTVKTTGLGEDGYISTVLIRTPGENVGTYYYTGHSYTGSLNYNVSVNLSATDDVGAVFRFEIIERIYNITPKQFTIQWDEWTEGIQPLTPTETINVVMPLTTVSVDLTYSRTGGESPDAGIYDIIGIYETNENISFKISGTNNSGGKNKYIIVGRPVTLQIKDFIKVYGEADPDFYSDSNFKVKISDLPTTLQNAYNANPENFVWSDLIKCTRQLGENYIPGGYQITYTFIGEEAKNYRLQLYEFNDITVLKTSAVLMIEKYVVDIADIDIAYSNSKIYDGNNRIDQRKISLKPESRALLSSKNQELFNRGFNVSGMFISTTEGEADSDAGINKKIKVYFSVNADSVNNFTLPDPFVICENGRIDKVKMPITLSRITTETEPSIYYGESPTIISNYHGTETVLYQGNTNVQFHINYGKYKNTEYSFVGSDSPTLLNLSLRVVYSDSSESIVCNSNIKDAGNYVVKLALNENANIKNYDIIYHSNEEDVVFNDADSFTSSFIIKQKTIEIIPSGVVFRKPADSTTLAHITNEHFILYGLLEKDIGLVNISYAAELNTFLPDDPNAKVIVKNISISGGSQSSNYILANESFEIEARILSLARIKFNKPNPTHFNNNPVVVSPEVEYYIPGATLKLNNEIIVPGSTNSDLDGYNTTVNIKVYYQGKEGVFYAKSSTPPKNAGIYIVSSEITNDSGYTLRGPTTELEIKKVKPTIVLDGNSYQEYGTCFQEFTARAIAEGLDEALEVSYSFAEENGLLPLYPKAGYHTVIAKYQAPAQTELNPFSNYISTEVTREIKISQKQVRIVFDLKPKDTEGNIVEEFIYNGRDKIPELGISIQGIAPNDTCYPILQIRKDNQPFTQTQIIDAAQYFINVGVSNDSYYIAGTSSISIRVKKAVLKVIPVIDKSTPAGQKPAYTLHYEGFLPGDSEEDLLGLPSLSLSNSQVGTNIAQPSGGIDSNYEYEYITEEYEIIYEKPTSPTENNMMYIIIGSIAGVIVLIVLISILSRRSMLKAFSKKHSKRK